MVRYVMINFVQEATQRNMTRLFMIIGSDFYLNRYLLNNGLVAWKQQEVEWRQWMSAPAKMKITILTGKEVLYEVSKMRKRNAIQRICQKRIPIGRRKEETD